MNLLLSFFVAAGVAAFAYTKLGRRIGYGNSAGVWKTVAVVFVVAFIFLYSLLTWVLHFH